MTRWTALLLPFLLDPDLTWAIWLNSWAIGGALFALWYTHTSCIRVWPGYKTFNCNSFYILSWALMTFWAWLKSMLKTDNAQGISDTKHHGRYYVRGMKGRRSRIATKGLQTIRGPILSAFQTNTEAAPDLREDPISTRFDSDSFIIGVDNQASCCMTNKKSHFITPIERLPHQRVKGIGGLVQAKGRGTIRWKVEDDDGRVHTFDIPNSLYVPDLPICLLCPQHWAKEANDHFPK